MNHTDTEIDWLPDVDPQSPTPLYEQILEAVAVAIAAGELGPGVRLPSVRTLATELRLNPNTTARALRAVEREGLARAVRGVGTLVAEDGGERAVVLARRALTRELGSAVRVARRLGMNRATLAAALDAAWEEDGDADRNA